MPCKWSVWNEFEDKGTFDTQCGQVQSFIEGGIKENMYNYCPYCGQIIEEV